jgi:hypothetical protein
LRQHPGSDDDFALDHRQHLPIKIGVPHTLQAAMPTRHTGSADHELHRLLASAVHT